MGVRWSCFSQLVTFVGEHFVGQITRRSKLTRLNSRVLFCSLSRRSRSENIWSKYLTNEKRGPLTSFKLLTIYSLQLKVTDIGHFSDPITFDLISDFELHFLQIENIILSFKNETGASQLDLRVLVLFLPRSRFWRLLKWHLFKQKP